jgi:pyruvate/2-oxoglutarate dehydrogenase complex dihydrolipoamide dehydrogenase (E3) component
VSSASSAETSVLICAPFENVNAEWWPPGTTCTSIYGTKRQLPGSNVIINTATRASIESIPGLADAQPLTHTEALELDVVPSHLIVLGSCYVEFAQAMGRFGSKILKATVKRISGKSRECVRILLEKNGNGAKKTVEGSHLSAATGRTPNTQGIGFIFHPIRVTTRLSYRLNLSASGCASTWRAST